MKTSHMVRLCWAIGAPCLLLLSAATSCNRLRDSAASEARAERLLSSLHPGWYPATDTDKMTGEIREKTWVIGQGADTSRQSRSDDVMPLLRLECRVPRKGAPAFDVAFSPHRARHSGGAATVRESGRGTRAPGCARAMRRSSHRP